MAGDSVRSRAVSASALGGLLGVTTLALVVLQFGREHPSPPSLEDEPNPAIPGEILFRNADGCVVRAAASGATREDAYCGNPTGATRGWSSVLWLDERTIGFVVQSASDPGAADIVEVDLQTKMETIRTNVADASIAWDQGALSPGGDHASIDADGTLIITREGAHSSVTSFDVGDPTRITPAGWSPDGAWIVLRYRAPRGGGTELWLVSRDGSTRGTLAKGSNWDDSPVGRPSWLIPGAGVSPRLEDFPR